MAGQRPRGDGGRPAEPRQPGDERSPEQEGSFGSFISDSVRRSAGQFRDEPGQRRRRRGTGRFTTGERAERPERPERRERVDRGERPRRATRPGERQRRQSFVPVEPEGDPPAEDDERAGATDQLPVWLQDLIDRVGGSQRALIALGVLLVGLVALIWLLGSVIGDDENGGDPTPTESLQVVPPIGQEATPGVPGSGGIVTPTPTSSVPTLPPLNLGGSDNVLDQQDGTPAAQREEPAASCGEACLARVERSPDAERVLASAGTRPSFSGEGWLWFIAQPDQMETIATELEPTVIRESDSTLRLYMTRLPGPGQAEWAPYELGEVIDVADTYYLVETERAPVDVDGALDAGLTVEKVAPAPPETLGRPENLPELTEADVGALGAKVESERLGSMMAEFQSMGAANGTGLGTRHYTMPGSQIAADYLYRELESYGFEVWYEDFVTWQGYLVVNVVGELPGRDTSRLYGVMAHLDSISENPTVLAPGADDNATGMAGALEIARVLSQYDLKYSLQVAFVNVEEEGIIGAEKYAQNSLAAGVPWEGVFNLDSIGSSRHGKQIFLNATGESIWMQELIQRVNSGYGFGERLEIAQDPDIVADDNRLREEGVEAVLIARELYGMSPVHHTERDVLDNVSIEHTRSATALVLATVGALMI